MEQRLTGQVSAFHRVTVTASSLDHRHGLVLVRERAVGADPDHVAAMREACRLLGADKADIQQEPGEPDLLRAAAVQAAA